MGSECAICAKHQGIGPLVGPVIFENDLIIVTHRPLDQASPIPGYLFIETRRHTPTLATLTDPEAAAVGTAVTRAAQALQKELTPEHVFSAITGRTVPHFHQHIFARPLGTPPTIPWTDVDSWPDSPRTTPTALNTLCARLSTHFPRQ
ncbi:HIT domain-containing protein [Nocardia colli]|uniref:HIT domain-containing protein n=1 Tax=Nocardia colli TaxID=2545717 RepID=A0A5N0EAB8_9NOCA|nr:HIT domain-containing protein [Nocardia colli]KAA8884461.1 HIT domain-containing protein [Nocardia colli]